MADLRCGAHTKLDGTPVGVCLDDAYPGTPGEYGYKPVRAIGHYDMRLAVGSGRAPRCMWTHSDRSASFDVVAIRRHGVLSAGSVASDLSATEDGASSRDRPRSAPGRVSSPEAE